LLNESNIPHELKALNQWVLWGVGKDKDKHKIPYTPKEMIPAKAGNPATWGTFKKALERVTTNKAMGVGFEFNDNCLYGVDLDKVITGGKLSKEAADIVNLLNSYTEISPSGAGLHILVKAKGINLESNRRGFIEIYNKDRYFTVTGDLYGDLKPIEERTEQLQTVYDKYLKKAPQKSIQRNAEYIDDREYLKNGLVRDDMLKKLWNGSRPNGNESSDDMAFFNKLAYWCNNNKDLMEVAFINSPYYAAKDDEHKRKCSRKDYIERTIKEALSNSTARSDNKRYTENNKTALPITNKPNKSDTSETPIKGNSLNTFSAVELQDTEIEPLRWVVVDLLPQGLNLLCSPPKYGKSWLVLDLCLSVAHGEEFLNKETTKSGALYLALEDSKRRLKDRMKKVLNGKSSAQCFDFATESAPLLDDGGLIPQLEQYIKAHADIGLIVIDTFQKVRANTGRQQAYDKDYDDMGKLKKIADNHKICILLVHHLRKMKDESDVFNMISGTNGLSGAADTILVLSRNSRNDEKTTLSVTGRDIDSNEFTLDFDKTLFKWRMIGTSEDEKERQDRLDYDNNPVVKTIKGLLSYSISITMSAKDFSFEMPKYADAVSTATSIGMAFRRLAYSLYKYDKIIYSSPSDTKSRKHTFTKQQTFIPYFTDTGATGATIPP